MTKSIFVIILSIFSCLVFGDTRYESESKKLASVWVEAKGYEPSSFVIKSNCDLKSCEILVYPKQLDSEKYRSFRGCPIQICVTLTYDISSQTIIDIVHWK